jgi:hypothetical protein
LAALNIFEYADPDTTITGGISATLLNALVEWLQKEYLSGGVARFTVPLLLPGAVRSRRCS